MEDSFWWNSLSRRNILVSTIMLPFLRVTRSLTDLGVLYVRSSCRNS